MLRQRREARRLTRAELAELAGLTAKTVQRAEAGGPVTPAVARALVAVLGLHLADILPPDQADRHDRLRAAGRAPMAPPTDWVPREHELELLLARLGCEHHPTCPLAPGQPACPLPRGAADRRCALTGPPGIGKTALALQAALALAPHFADGLAWIDGADLAGCDRPMAAVREIAGALGFEAQLPGASAHARELFQAFRQRFWARRRLLVLDDVRAPEHLEPFIDGDLGGSLLVTTRSRAVADRLGGPVVEVGPVRPEVARGVLETSLDPARLAGDQAGVAALLALLCEAPGQLVLAARLIAREHFTRPSDLVLRLTATDEAARGWWERGALSPLRDLAATLSPAAAELWATLSVFEDRPFSAESLAALVESPPEHTARALSELHELHLVRAAPEASAMLRLGPLATLLGRLELGERRSALAARLSALGLA